MDAGAALPVPDDALADIFGRLPPCALAASRCVCKAWRALVDARGLLLAHLLPHALRGIFINYSDYVQPLFFARNSSEFPVSAATSATFPASAPTTHFLDHCNGLLLYQGESEYYVINPATRRWESFSSPRVDRRGDNATYLVFDPAVSPHYEVFLIPCLPEPDEDGVRQEHDPPTSSFNLSGFLSGDDDTLAMEAVEEEQQVLEELAKSPPPPSLERGFFPSRKLSLPARWRLGKPDDPYGSMEWPQSPCTLHVFSSSTRRWEERQFVREGEPVGTVEGARWQHYQYSRYGVYCQGTLYVHCRGGFVMRFSLKLGKYRAIKTPEDIEDIYAQCYLGRSIGRVYFAKMCRHQLRIWNLNNELSGEAEWVLKHHVDLDRSALWAAVRSSKCSVTRGPWVLMYSDSEEVSDSETSADGSEDSETYADSGEDSDSEVSDSETYADGGEDNETYADSGEDSSSEVIPEEYFEWDSDDGCIVDYEDGDVDEYIEIYILGFHPYEEVVFLMVSFVAVAYHLSTSKVQLLGKSLPRDYGTWAKRVDEAFPYTPCMIGDLLNHYDYETSSED